MKALFKTLLIISIAVVSLSCNKEEPRPNYYYKFKVNGVQKEFSASNMSNIVYIDDVNSGIQISFFTMVTGSDQNKNSMIISLRTSNPLVIGDTYNMQDEILVQGQVVPSMAIIYLDENGREFSATKLQRTNPGAADNGSITLTAFDTEGSMGTFEAIVFDERATGNLATRVPVRITDGEFFLPNFVSNR
jgi:hypothetical protein